MIRIFLPFIWDQPMPCPVVMGDDRKRADGVVGVQVGPHYVARLDRVRRHPTEAPRREEVWELVERAALLHGTDNEFTLVYG